jgi:hypothetical protein
LYANSGHSEMRVLDPLQVTPLTLLVSLHLARWDGGGMDASAQMRHVHCLTNTCSSANYAFCCWWQVRQVRDEFWRCLTTVQHAPYVAGTHMTTQPGSNMRLALAMLFIFYFRGIVFSCSVISIISPPHQSQVRRAASVL